MYHYFLAYCEKRFSKVEEREGVKLTDVAKSDMKRRRDQEYNRAEKVNGFAHVSVVGDGGWGKRSLGHSYNSSTGKL